jgi:uroporphyrinogen-III decarboxylase
MPSKLGAVEAALHTIIEATSITTCYYAQTAPQNATASRPYAVTAPLSGAGVTFDINSRNRPVVNFPIEVHAHIDKTGQQQVPADKLYTVMEELIIAFDSTANRTTLAALPGFIDFWVENWSLMENGEVGMLDCKLEMDYPY